MALLRIDKILSSQEIASRKEIKMLIKQGRIKVDGKIVARSEDKFDPENCEITLDDEPILYKRYIYIMLNKPKGVVSASRDSREKTVLDLLPPELRRKDLFPAGRLDRNTEGLLIITDDGEFSHKLLAPKSHVNKLYEAVVDRKLAENDVEKENKCVESSGIDEVKQIAKTFDIDDINLIKPGIGEATRVLLRRVPWKILIDERYKGDPQLGHLVRLAEEKNVSIQYYPMKHYKCCGIIKKMSDI